VLTGDIHSSWAADLTQDPNNPVVAAGGYDPANGAGSRAVEFITTSFTSPAIPDPSGSTAALLRSINPHFKYIEFTRRGYVLLDVTRAKVTTEWWYLDTVESPSAVHRRSLAEDGRYGPDTSAALQPREMAGWRGDRVTDAGTPLALLATRQPHLMEMTYGKVLSGLDARRARHRPVAAVSVLSLSEAAMTTAPKTPNAPTPAGPDASGQEQRQALLDAQRKAHQDQPRSVKEDALTDKIVTVEPDGTGPTPTQTFDPDQDQIDGQGEAAGSKAPRGKSA